MLNAVEAVATVAVKNIDRARDFYEQTLELQPEPVGEGMESVRTYKSGGSSLLVYESETGGTNEATSVTWAVEDVDAEVEALKARGVRFEHYDMPDTTLDGDVHVSGDHRAAWFKDPDGNILAVVSRK